MKGSDTQSFPARYDEVLIYPDKVFIPFYLLTAGSCFLGKVRHHFGVCDRWRTFCTSCTGCHLGAFGLHLAVSDPVSRAFVASTLAALGQVGYRINPQRAAWREKDRAARRSSEATSRVEVWG